MGNQEKKTKISYVNTNFTSIVSVALVLLLLGMGAVLGLMAHSMTERVLANIGFDVSMAYTASDADVLAMKRQLTSAPYTASVKYVSREEALLTWQEETGEDLMQVLGVNPLTAEFEVHVKPEYATIDSLNVIEATLRSNPAVEVVHVHRDQVETISRNIGNTLAVLGVLAAVLLIISFALINNTVRLTVYSRRFLIYTMRLVGAKPGFIRRPIIVSNILNGVIAALLASVLLGAALFYFDSLRGFEGVWATLVTPLQVWGIYGGLLVIGSLLCGLGALLASNKYMSLDYDELFRR